MLIKEDILETVTQESFRDSFKLVHGKNVFELRNCLIKEDCDMQHIFKLIDHSQYKIFISNCRFENHINLIQTDKSKLIELEFNFCDFDGPFECMNTLLLNRIVFSDSTFSKNVKLKLNITKNADFVNLNIIDYADSFEISTSNFENASVLFNSVKCNHVSLKLKDINFGKYTSFIQCELTQVLFENTNLENIKFLDCHFKRFNRHDFHKLKRNLKTSDDLNSFRKKLNIRYIMYRELEINLDKNKDYEQAGEFHKLRFDIERAVTNKPKERIFSLKKNLLHFYKISSDYGESYSKSLVFYLAVLIFFSLLYLFTGIIYVYPDKEQEVVINYLENRRYNFSKDISTSLLFSLNSSLPFRKDLEFVKSGNSVTTFFSIIETIIQTILATLFIIGLRRKFKR